MRSASEFSTLRRRLAVILSLVLALSTSTVQGLDKSSAPDCTQLHANLLDFYRSIPTDFSTMATADRVATRAQQSIEKARLYLTKCSERPDAEVGDVSVVYAKCLYLLVRRFRMQAIKHCREDTAPDLAACVTERVQDYLAEIERVSRNGLSKLAPESPLRPRAWETLIYALYESRRLPETEAACKQFIQTFPSDESVHKIVNALGRTYLEAEAYDHGIELLKAAIKTHYKSDSYPFFVETLRKLYMGNGDVAGFERTVDNAMLVFPLKATNPKNPPRLRQALERYSMYYGFWKGYSRLAAGDLEGAQEAFREHIRTLNDREKELVSLKQQLKPEYAIYRGRSSTTLEFLEKLGGRPAPRELELAWIDNKELLLSDSLGTVTGILFRGVDELRSRDFMARMSHICNDNPEFQMAAVHFLRGNQEPKSRGTVLNEEISTIGYVGPAGFDPDPEDQSVFRAFNVKVGSASFVILDRSGNLVWFMEDPRPLDVPFVQAVMKRVANET